MTDRRASVQRETRETRITAELNIDGRGKVNVATGVGFFDHMLTSAMVHGFFDLDLKAEGDTHVDDHHTVEDVGIVLGRAFAEALGDFAGIRRFGWACVPMEEALGRAAVDLARRPCLVYSVEITTQKIGDFDAQLGEEFWRSFCNHSGANLHLDALRGRNMHHVFEAIFKSAGRALDQAVAPDPRASGAVSTKGVL